jgi:hypothetical protein
LSAVLAEPRRAEQGLRRPLTEHRRVGTPPLEARTALELAVVLRRAADLEATQGRLPAQYCPSMKRCGKQPPCALVLNS